MDQRDVLEVASPGAEAWGSRGRTEHVSELRRCSDMRSRPLILYIVYALYLWVAPDPLPPYLPDTPLISCSPFHHFVASLPVAHLLGIDAHLKCDYIMIITWSVENFVIPTNLHSAYC